jgi:hypothetical protein
MACPICVSSDGTAMTTGMQAGAGLLILVTASVIAMIARFAVRLWMAERAEGAEKITVNQG